MELNTFEELTADATTGGFGVEGFDDVGAEAVPLLGVLLAFANSALRCTAARSWSSARLLSDDCFLVSLLDEG